MVAYVSEILVCNHPTSFHRGRLDDALVVSDNLVPPRASSEAEAHTIVSARYTCCGPCTRKAARKFPL